MRKAHRGTASGSLSDGPKRAAAYVRMSQSLKGVMVDLMGLGMNADIVSHPSPFIPKLSSCVVQNTLLTPILHSVMLRRCMRWAVDVQVELEQTLLPEAEQIVELSKTLEHQSSQLERASSDIAKLKRERRLIKSGGTTDYPANLEANETGSKSPCHWASLSSLARAKRVMGPVRTGRAW